MEKKELFKGKKLERVAGVAGLGLGFGAASAVGTAMGSAGLLGTIGSACGLTVAATTPVGWLIGGAIVGGAALKYGAQIIGAKGKSDGIYKIMENRLIEQKQKKMQQISAKLAQADINKAIQLWDRIKIENLAEPNLINEIVEGLKKGVNSANEAIELACAILGLDINGFLTDKQITIEELNLIIALAVVMLSADKECKQEEFDATIDIISDYYTIEKNDADYLLTNAIENYISMMDNSKANINPKIIFIVAAECFYLNTHLHTQVLNILEKVALSDGVFHEDEKAIYEFAKRCFNMAKSVNAYESVIQTLPENEPNLFFADHEKFSKKLSNAINAYAFGINPNQAIALYDNTRFGAGDNGFILNKLGLINDQGDIVFYNELEKVKYSDNGIILRTTHDDILLNYKINETSRLPKYFNSIAAIADDT